MSAAVAKAITVVIQEELFIFFNFPNCSNCTILLKFAVPVVATSMINTMSKPIFIVENTNVWSW